MQPFSRTPVSSVWTKPSLTMTNSQLRQLLSWMRFMGDDFCLGGGFKYFLFSPLFGEMIHFD